MLKNIPMCERISPLCKWTIFSTSPTSARNAETFEDAEMFAARSASFSSNEKVTTIIINKKSKNTRVDCVPFQ